MICSSFEVLASMLLSEETFIELKERLVAEIVVRLRELARLEAETLFREHRHLPGVPLPALSTRLSRVIIRATDALTRALARLKTEDPALVHVPAARRRGARLPAPSS